MTEKFSDRLTAARKSLLKSQVDMAKMVGVSHGAWQSYELGRSVPGSQVLGSLARLGFAGDWLLTGNGPMKRGEKAGGDRSAMPELPFDAELYMQVVQAVLEVAETYDRPPRAATLMELIRLLHDEIKEGELESEEVKKNVVRILKFAS